MVQQGNGRNWSDSFFVVLKASGPHNGTADELIKQAYNSQNMDHFLPLLEKAGTDAKLALLEAAYSDNREDYLMFLLDELPENTNVDDLAERAIRDNNQQMSMWLLERTSAAKKKELAKLALGNSTISDNIIGDVLYELSQTEKDELLRECYQLKSMHAFQLVLNEASETVCAELLPKVYDDSRIEYFSLLVDHTPDFTLRELAKRSFAEQKYAFQTLLTNYIS